MGSSAAPFVPPLFARFDRLRHRVPYMVLGTFPTPVGTLDGLRAETGKKIIFVKKDDLSGPLYGGNKVRKLEFLLADARSCGAVRVITCGAAGSNHALATALYARRTGLKATLILFDQPVSDAVRSNLLMDAETGAEMVYVERYDDYGPRLRELIERYGREDGRPPYVIPAGGSSPMGVLGYVNAAFELRGQIETGDLPEPGTIVVPFGTMGTVVGLALGLRAAECKTTVCAVRVVPSSLANRDKCRELFLQVLELIRSADPSFPAIPFEEAGITVNSAYFEPGYGLASSRVVEAIWTGYRTDRLELDATYSGKAFAAFLDQLRGTRDGSPLLFWDTKNSRPLPTAATPGDHRKLPLAFHRFFSQPSGSQEDHGNR